MGIVRCTGSSGYALVESLFEDDEEPTETAEAPPVDELMVSEVAPIAQPTLSHLPLEFTSAWLDLRLPWLPLSRTRHGF